MTAQSQRRYHRNQILTNQVCVQLDHVPDHVQVPFQQAHHHVQLLKN